MMTMMKKNKESGWETKTLQRKLFTFLLVALPPHCLLQPLPPPPLSFHLISCRRRHQIHTSTFSFCDAKTVVVLCCHQDHIISLFSKFQYLHIFPLFLGFGAFCQEDKKMARFRAKMYSKHWNTIPRKTFVTSTAILLKNKKPL